MCVYVCVSDAKLGGRHSSEGCRCLHAGKCSSFIEWFFSPSAAVLVLFLHLRQYVLVRNLPIIIYTKNSNNNVLMQLEQQFSCVKGKTS